MSVRPSAFVGGQIKPSLRALLVRSMAEGAVGGCPIVVVVVSHVPQLMLQSSSLAVPTPPRATDPRRLPPTIAVLPYVSVRVLSACACQCVCLRWLRCCGARMAGSSSVRICFECKPTHAHSPAVGEHNDPTVWIAPPSQSEAAAHMAAPGNAPPNEGKCRPNPCLSCLCLWGTASCVGLSQKQDTTAY